jgi:hypothetical protein
MLGHQFEKWAVFLRSQKIILGDVDGDSIRMDAEIAHGISNYTCSDDLIGDLKDRWKDLCTLK